MRLESNAVFHRRSGLVILILFMNDNPDITGLVARLAQLGSGRLRAIRRFGGQLLKTVRRDKAPVRSGRQTRPGTGSLHPVAIEATAEATKPLEPSV